MADTPLNVLSLCSGVGGLDLGIRLALPRARAICMVEREVAACASLAASMEAGWIHPCPIWMGDMCAFDARPFRGLVHILASGDPCQDNSVAGKRAGADGERFLAAEVCRLAAECRPDLVFRENVPGNADGQLGAIVPALERLGYRVAAGIFSSAETGNTMRRERLFIMAVADGGSGGDRGIQRGGQFGFQPEGDGVGGRDDPAVGRAEGAAGRTEQQSGGAGRGRARPAGTGGNVGLAAGAEPQGQRNGGLSPGQRQAAGRHSQLSGRAAVPPAVIPGPSDSRWIDVLDRFPELQPALSQEEAQSHLRRGIDAMAHRVERLRATGNGVDPVVAATAFLSLGARLGIIGK